MTPAQFKRIRKTQLRLTQAELGEILDVSLDTVGRWETGAYPIPGDVTLAMAWLACFGAGDPFSGTWTPPMMDAD